MADPGAQRVDLAVRAIKPGDLRLHPIRRQAAGGLREVFENRREQAQVAVAQQLGEIRDRADLPEQTHRRPALRGRRAVGPAGEGGQRAMILRVALAR